jgi:predicted amidohydrolase YtcJ
LNLKLLKRRVEMLDTVNKGFHPAVVIGQLAEKYKVSERCLWSDWERRMKWVPVLLGLEKYTGFAEGIEAKLNAVQKAAWSIYVHADNDNARVGALKVVLDSLEVYSSTVLSRDILLRLEHVEELAEKKVLEKRR